MEGPDAGRAAEPREPDAVVTVGTSEDNVLGLSDATVSRYHLEIARVDGGFSVRDLGSLNGTLVDALWIERAVVPAGTRVTIGETALVLDDGAVASDAARVEMPRRPEIAGLVGDSPAMRRIAEVAARLGASDVSVLIDGETGTGKEVVARAIHALSARRDGPFVVVDCGSMPATLIASELFGHTKGAFTGATQSRVGAFSSANEGTVFLDEIGELPPDLQPALLGVLERRRFRPVGSDRERAVDVRVIAATNRDLRSEVNRGDFRADLYFRIAVAKLHIPPLRERPEDVAPLIRHFVAEATGDPGVDVFGEDVIARLAAQRWTGNARELRNVVEAALAMGEAGLDDSGPSVGPPSEDGPLVPYKVARADAIAAFERSYLERLIGDSEGNASEAARRAKMDRPYLLSLLRKHGLR
ncbi:MAG: sigma 54-interacting transcriptional regulator [Sandaracinaceae bacterium]